MSKTLVIGGTGFIGSRVVHRLLSDGHSIRCLVRASSRTDRIDNLPLEKVQGELRDPASLSRAAEGCDSIIHAGGISAWSDIDSPDMHPVVVDGTRNVLDAAIKQGVARMVFVSSAAAMGPSSTAEPRDESAAFSERDARGLNYVLAKREAENLCLQAGSKGLETVIVRPAEVYGPGDRDLITASNLIGLLKSSPVFVCRGGTSMVHVDDVAHSIVNALNHGHPGETYLLGGENLHHSELARLLLELTGRRETVITIPAVVLRLAGAVAKRCRLPFPFPPAVVPYATRYWFLDNTKAERELKHNFRSARATLTETLSWLKATGTTPFPSL